ncbi:hypothetical protein SLS56_007117 [Neofusicoccum ribis]|uniref:aldehyde dehydrogenase (NAD(+)) n=1 Tax=Neofusicoccum ribis TaxID=45134 RepID=A0ABR3SNR3_9PEZI
MTIIFLDSQDAFLEFRKTSLSWRKSLVEKALSIIHDRKELLGRELTMQMGRPINYSTKEIDTMQKRAAYLLNICRKALADIPGIPEAGFKRWISKEPVGPCLLVFAWNFPYLIVVNSLIPALLTGNNVVLKPSPQVPLVAERLVEIFREAGFPPNVVQSIHSSCPDTLSKIVRLPEIGLIAFTGSTAGGLKLREATASRLVPLVLELGGNDPAFVRPDADLEYVAAQIVDGAVFNSGQSCCAVERVYVHADVYNSFVKEVQKELSGYRMGDPFDESTNVGPVISEAAAKAIKEHIEDALSKGASDYTPANISFEAPCKGNYVSPRVLVNVDHSMRVMKEETFGPVIPIARVASDEEAVTLMNDGDYGLSASVWTKDIEAGEAIIQKLDAGTVFINRCDYPNPDLAWTGWKNSGLGSTLGPCGFDAFLKLKSYHIKETQA